MSHPCHHIIRDNCLAAGKSLSQAWERRGLGRRRLGVWWMGLAGKPSLCLHPWEGATGRAELFLQHFVLLLLPVKKCRGSPAFPLCSGVWTKPFGGALGWDLWLCPALGKHKGLSLLPHMAGAHQQSCPQLTWCCTSISTCSETRNSGHRYGFLHLWHQ